jgi:hypothetical protein
MKIYLNSVTFYNRILICGILALNYIQPSFVYSNLNNPLNKNKLNILYGALYGELNTASLNRISVFLLSPILEEKYDTRVTDSYFKTPTVIKFQLLKFYFKKFTFLYLKSFNSSSSSSKKLTSSKEINMAAIIVLFIFAGI